MTYNQSTMTITLSRHEITDLIIACNTAEDISQATKWAELHNKLVEQLEAYDEEHFNEYIKNH